MWLVALALQLASCTFIDGDTLRCGAERIRLADIDAPETGSGARCDAEAMLADLAAAALARELEAGGLVIERRARDTWGRTIAVISRDGQSIGERLIDQGVAVAWRGRQHDWCASPPD
ncbi:MAG: thermonuclease family protein [Glycocaulis sp.]